MFKKNALSLLMFLLLLFVRLLVSLRYRIEVRGLECLIPGQFKRQGGILFLPNHPAEIDPVLLEMILWKPFRPRALVVEHFYNLKGFKFFMDLVGAMPLPAMDTVVSTWRAKKVEKQFHTIASALKGRNNFLIYPSGRLKHTGIELIGGASFVHRLIGEVPEANVVLIRTTGLWGSSFSRALTGASPDFGRVLFGCAKILLKNGIFFARRRHVLIELELPPEDFPWQGSRLEFNRFLENWYNRYPGPGFEPLTLVSYAFWKKELPKVFVPQAREPVEEQRPVSARIQKEVYAHLATLCGRSPEEIERPMHLSNDLGLDSLDVAQLYVFLDERYGVSEVGPGDLQTVEDLLQFAMGAKREGKEGEEPCVKVSFAWPREKRLPPQIPDGETIQEVFLRSAERGRSAVACLDALSGPMSYSKFRIAALVLAQKFRQLSGERIGIMLPSSTGAYLVILAVLLANRVPVMLNWTAGSRSLDHAVDLTGLEVVVTSMRFLDNVESADFGRVEEKLLFLEEIRKTIRFRDKLRALILSFLNTGFLLKKLGLKGINPSDPAVILFTSGTESLPKGVPLSHFNLLSNQRAALQCVSLQDDDILYGVLPPFHSFGFSFTGLLPLLMGMRICFAPDPTDSHGMKRDIAAWKPTLFCSPPSFIRALFHVAKPEQLGSLRLIVAGAEKTPRELFDYVRERLPSARLLEAYGITECSPVVTIDRPGEPHYGVGRPIPGVEVMILDTVAMQPVPVGAEGEVCICGPCVFSGYLDHPRSPFITVNGRQWYLSGDRGHLNEKGHLILSGRLKRFVKIGGEMVSLGGLEEELLKIALERGWISGKEEGPPLAASVREKESEKPAIILFATFMISKEEINAALKSCGLGRIVKIAEVRILDAIPLTGTGKTHYRCLDDSVN
jgi:long-chain-fatty-acid--[acyl-carrier-protein] ligase